MTVLVAVAPAGTVAVGGTPAEQRAAEGLAPRRRREFLHARALLRWAVSRHVGVAAGDVEVLAEPGGRPVLTGVPGVSVSIAHSTAAYAVAVASGPGVGIDVEGPVRPDPGLVRRFCAAPQRAALAALPEPVRTGAFTTVWTVQEACVKATGEGLRGDPARVGALIGADRGRWRNVRWRVLPAYLGHAMAIALAGPAHGPLRAVTAPGGRPLYEIEL